MIKKRNWFPTLDESLTPSIGNGSLDHLMQASLHYSGFYFFDKFMHHKIAMEYQRMKLTPK